MCLEISERSSCIFVAILLQLRPPYLQSAQIVTGHRILGNLSTIQTDYDHQKKVKHGLPFLLNSTAPSSVQIVPHRPGSSQSGPAPSL